MSAFDEENEISFYDGVPDDIRAKYEEWNKLYNKLIEKLVSKGLPVQAVFELTPLCNLSCKMCLVRLNKDKMDSIGKLMTAEQWTSIAEQTADMGTYVILITGGEPFTHPEFVDIYSNIAKLGFWIILFTNALMVNDKIIETLKKYPPNYLYITMYGSSEETYEKVCGNGKAYNSVVNNIKMLKNILKNITIALRTTIIKDNINDLNDLKKFAEQMQMKFTFSFGTIKPIRGAECDDIEKIRLSPEEIINIRKEALASIKDKQLYDIWKKGIEKLEETLFGHNVQTIDNSDDARKFSCSASKLMYTISWDGKMLPCQIFSSPYTLPLNIGIKSAWDELRNAKKAIRLPFRCIQCRYRQYCGICPAIAQAESGTYIDEESYKCMKLYN